MRLAGRMLAGCILLLPVPALADAENVKLNGPLAVNHAIAVLPQGTFSPRSDLVVYSADQVEGGRGFYVVSVTGGTPLQLAPQHGGLSSISPDGEWLVFQENTPPGAHLYSVPVEGGAVNELNPPVVGGGEVFFHRIHPDSSRVLYVAEQEAIDAHELFSVPIGGGAATKLNAPFEDGDGGVISLGITPNGEWAFFVAGERFVVFEEDGLQIRRLVDTELFRVPLSGGGAAESAEDVQPVAPPRNPPVFSPDSSRFIFQARQSLSDPRNLYSAPLLGGEAAQLNPPITALNGYVGSAVISPDSSRVVFDGILENPASELYSVPLGGGPVIKLSEPRSELGGVLEAQVSPDSSRVVFRLFETMTDFRLYSVPLTGGPVVRLDAGIGAVAGSVISPDNSRVVYWTLAGDEGHLFSVPLTGGAAIPLGAGWGPVVFTPDSSRVVFLSGFDFQDGRNLDSVGVGGGRRSRLNGPLVTGGGVRSFWVTPDGERVIYQADQDTEDRFELYSSRIPALGPLLSIDIEPKRTPNEIKLRKKARVTVALLGSTEVDVGAVAPGSLAFGRSSAAPDGTAKRSDVNRDGFEDLVTRYKISRTGIQAGDTNACLTGEIAGDPFVACDAIATIP